MYVTKRVEGDLPKCVEKPTGGRVITPHMHTRTYTISFHVFVSWCLVLFVEI